MYKWATVVPFHCKVNTKKNGNNHGCLLCKCTIRVLIYDESESWEVKCKYDNLQYLYIIYN